MSSMKQLVLSLIATTISIALTFGTAAFLDHRKKVAEKHEMVMMILNDFDKTIKQVNQLDSAADQAFEAQLSILENPETFEESKFELILLQMAYKDELPKTTENIISSNIETINTLGNILFTEKVSEFYLHRKQLLEILDKEMNLAFSDEDGITSSYENLSKYNLVSLLMICEGYKKTLEGIYEQCKLMMDVSDKEIEDFTLKREKLNPPVDKEAGEKVIQLMKERNQRFEQAVEAGKQKKAS